MSSFWIVKENVSLWKNVNFRTFTLWFCVFQFVQVGRYLLPIILGLGVYFEPMDLLFPFFFFRFS